MRWKKGCFGKSVVPSEIVLSSVNMVGGSVVRISTVEGISVVLVFSEVVLSRKFIFQLKISCIHIKCAAIRFHYQTGLLLKNEK